MTDTDIFGELLTDLAVYLLRLEEFNLEIDEKQDWPLIVACYLEHGKWPDEISVGWKQRCMQELKKFGIHNGMFCRLEKGGGSVPYLAYKDRSAVIEKYHLALGHLKTRSILIGYFKK